MGFMRWSDEETETLRRLVASGNTAVTISASLRRPVESIQKKARDLGLLVQRRSPKIAARERIGRLFSG